MQQNEQDGISLVTLAGGAAVEKFDIELARVLDDLEDPNTDFKKPREVILKVRIHPGEGMAKRVEIFCDPKLGANKQVETMFLVGMDAHGMVRASEYRPKQRDIFDNDDKSQEQSGNVESLEGRRKIQ